MVTIVKTLLSVFVAGLLFASFACRLDDGSKGTQTGLSPEPVAAPSPTVIPTSRPFDPNLDIGVVIPGYDCSELFIRNDELTPGDEIQVVTVEEKPHKKFKATVVGPNNCRRSPKSELGEIVVNGVDTDPVQYEIRFEDRSENTFGFAVVSLKAKVEIIKGTAQLAASERSTPLFFRDCTGNESYHMTVWEGKPFVGKRVWHSYISIYYDTVPTCKPAEYK